MCRLRHPHYARVGLLQAKKHAYLQHEQVCPQTVAHSPGTRSGLLAMHSQPQSPVACMQYVSWCLQGQTDRTCSESAPDQHEYDNLAMTSWCTLTASNIRAGLS